MAKSKKVLKCSLFLKAPEHIRDFPMTCTVLNSIVVLSLENIEWESSS